MTDLTLPTTIEELRSLLFDAWEAGYMTADQPLEEDEDGNERVMDIYDNPYSS